jgi:hypothetical protein
VTWLPPTAALLLLAFVAAIHWSVWEPFRAELAKNAPVAVPLVGLLAAVVLLPPLAWALSLL